MNVRAILIGAAVAALGGFALYDYYSPESRRARAIHEVETLKPDVKPHACLPQGPLTKAFAAAVALDAMPSTAFDSDARKRGVIKHDCIRGATNHATVDRLLDVSGEEIVAYSAKVVDETINEQIKAAIHENDNPGKCVVEDEGLGEDGICRYVCRDQNSRSRYPKDPKFKGPCPLVHEPDANATKAPVNSAALSK